MFWIMEAKVEFLGTYIFDVITTRMDWGKVKIEVYERQNFLEKV